ncbi:MAG: hypothetical protein ACRDQD_12435 [Nocardioidaceae bacterium]
MRRTLAALVAASTLAVGLGVAPSVDVDVPVPGVGTVEVVEAVPVAAHVGDDPHAPDAWYADRDRIYLAKSENAQYSVGDGWRVASFVDGLRDHAPFIPVYMRDDCTDRPADTACMTVFEVCQQDHDYVNVKRKFFGVLHGKITLNHCAGGPPDVRDVTGTCRIVMRMLGAHVYSGGTGCLANPWSLAADRPAGPATDNLNLGYYYNRGCQIPCTTGNAREGDEPDDTEVGYPKPSGENPPYEPWE